MPETSAVGRPRSIDWQPIRDAFVRESPRPSFTELAARFATAVSTVANCAREENWPEIRAGYFEQKLKEAGASELILKAIQGEGAILQQARNLVVQFITTGEVLLEAIQADDVGKTSTRVSTFNNLGFAFANIGRFIECVGLIGMPKDLRNSKRNSDGNDAGQPWEPGMLQQINVTVNGIQAEAAKLAKAEKAADPVEVVGAATDGKPAGGF